MKWKNRDKKFKDSEQNRKNDSQTTDRAKFAMHRTETQHTKASH